MLVFLFFCLILRTYCSVSFPVQCNNPEQYVCSTSVINSGTDFTRCSDGADYDPACQGGFFDSDYRTNETSVPPSIGYSVPCCPGYYCSRTTACLQPCSKGSWCTLSIPKGGYCDPYSYPNATGHCGGALVDNPCPSGYYCPNSIEIKNCSSGHYCPLGSTQQYQCTGYFSGVDQLDYCGENTPHDQFRGRNVFWAVFIILFVVLVYSTRNFILGSVQGNKPKEFENMEILVSSLNAPNSFLRTKPNQIEVSQIEVHDIKVWRNGKMGFSKTLDVNEEMILRSGVTAIIGLSGAGKSTLLETLVGKMDFYYHLDAKITFSVNAQKTVMDYRKDFFPKYGDCIAFVPQDDIFHQPLTVWETVLYSSRLRTHYSYKQCRELTAYWLHKLGLSAREDWMKLTTDLSGGMKKRVNVAMELVTDPQLLILDEPTSGLDTKTTESLLTALKEFAEGKAFTVSSDVNEVLLGTFSKRIVIAVIHQPSFEVSEKFHYILGVKKISDIGVFDLPFYEWSLLQQKYVENSPRKNFMDSYVLDLDKQTAEFVLPVEDKRTFDLGCCECRSYYPISWVYFYPMHCFIGCERGFALFFRRLWEFFVYTTLALFIGGLLGYDQRDADSKSSCCCFPSLACYFLNLYANWISVTSIKSKSVRKRTRQRCTCHFNIFGRYSR
jgi:ABC-type multidrug transport system ATPase subunit